MRSFCTCNRFNTMQPSGRSGYKIRKLHPGTLTIILFVATLRCHAQDTIAVFSFEPEALRSSVEVPMAIDLDQLTRMPDSALTLVETSQRGGATIPFQIEQGTARRLHWTITPAELRTTRTFALIQRRTPTHEFPVQLLAANGAIRLVYHGDDLIQYNYQMVYPPEGVDSAYRRSGFIHPLRSRTGHILTRIQ